MLFEMVEAEDAEASLEDLKTFIKDSINVKVTIALSYEPVRNSLLILYYLYLVTLGRVFEPAKYHLFQATYLEVSKQYSVDD